MQKCFSRNRLAGAILHCVPHTGEKGGYEQYRVVVPRGETFCGTSRKRPQRFCGFRGREKRLYTWGETFDLCRKRALYWGGRDPPGERFFKGETHKRRFFQSGAQTGGNAGVVNSRGVRQPWQKHEGTNASDLKTCVAKNPGEKRAHTRGELSAGEEVAHASPRRGGATTVTHRGGQPSGTWQQQRGCQEQHTSNETLVPSRRGEPTH